MDVFNDKLRKSPLRFLLFLLVVALLCWYVAWKWEKFNEETLRSQPEKTPDSMVTTTTSSGEKDEVEEATNMAENVEANASSSDFFAEAHFRRQQTRSEKRQTLLELVENEQTEEGISQKAQEELLALANKVESEREMEDLIASKGFDDSIVYMRQDAAMVIVKAEELSKDQVAVIVSLFKQFTDIPLENLSIMARTD